MKEPTELIEKSNGSRDVGGVLERSLTPYTRYDSYEDESNGYSRFRDYWRSVRKHLWMVIGIVVLVSGVTAMYMARQPDVYESRSGVQVDSETANNPAIGALKGNPIFLNNSSQDPNPYQRRLARQSCKDSRPGTQRGFSSSTVGPKPILLGKLEGFGRNQ